MIELLETRQKKLYVITTRNFHFRLRLYMAKLMIEKIRNNFNNRYEFNNKKYVFNNVKFENSREFSRYISQKMKTFEFNIADIQKSENDAINMNNNMVLINHMKEIN